MRRGGGFAFRDRRGEKSMEKRDEHPGEK